MISFTLKCIRIWQKYGKDEITVYAAQASFFLMLAFFPFLTKSTACGHTQFTTDELVCGIEPHV